MATSITPSCPSCGATILRDSPSCPKCGARSADETLELPVDPVVPNPGFASSQAEPRPSLHQVHRRPLGMHPAPLLGALASIAFLVAVILLASGSLVAGLIVLAVSLGCVALFLSACRHEPELPIARLTSRAADRSRSLCRLAAVTLHAWALAGLNLLLISRRQQQLHTRLRRQLKPLGEAVYQDDQTRAEALKRKAVELERELDGVKREASDVIDAARQEIARERATVEPTETLTPAQAEKDLPGGS